MKRIVLIRILTDEHAVVFVRNGGSHDIYRNPITGRAEAIPRHREINEMLARKIIRALTTPDPS